MRNRSIGIAVATLLALQPYVAWAQTGSPEYRYGPHMIWWDGGWPMFFFGPLFMILLLAILIAATVFLVRWFGGAMAGGAQPMPPQRTPVDILKERFAKGEIDAAEFEERKRVLG